MQFVPDVDSLLFLCMYVFIYLLMYYFIIFCTSTCLWEICMGLILCWI